VRKQRAGSNPPSPRISSYILNWSGLSAITHTERIQCAYASRRNWLVGDQTKVYVLELAPFDAQQLTGSELAEKWMQGPVREPLYREALKTAAGSATNSKCSSFPSLEVLDSAAYWLAFHEITAYDGRTEVVVVTAYEPRSRRLFHADVRW
jgi:hypothetical protein